MMGILGGRWIRVSWTRERLKVRAEVLKNEPLIQGTLLLRKKLGNEMANVFFDACEAHPQLVMAMSGTYLEDWVPRDG